MGVSDTGWEDRAQAWVAWARTPEHDAYWAYREAFFDLLPEPDGLALEVGCGEGRVCRDLTARGYRVTGLDASPSLVTAAAELDSSGSYVVGLAEQLPFSGDSFRLVIAYNTLMDVQDMPGAVKEAARVLEPGGKLCVCVTHPLADAGEWSDQAGDAVFVINGSYLESTPFESTMERDGMSMTFVGRTYSLESYSRALESAGLLVEAIREPVAKSGGALGVRWNRIPMFLMLRARKP